MIRMPVILTILALPTTAAVAGQSSQQKPLDALIACRAVSGDPARLACYDRAVQTLDGARKAGNVVVLDRAELEARQRAQFGVRRPADPLGDSVVRDRPERPVEQELTSKVTNVTSYGRGLWTVRLADGGVWRTTEPPKFDPRTGQTVTIRRGALGSYRASFAGARAVRIERLR